jgi:hypothetical protein
MCRECITCTKVNEPSRPTCSSCHCDAPPLLSRSSSSLLSSSEMKETTAPSSGNGTTTSNSSSPSPLSSLHELLPWCHQIITVTCNIVEQLASVLLPNIISGSSSGGHGAAAVSPSLKMHELFGFAADTNSDDSRGSVVLITFILHTLMDRLAHLPKQSHEQVRAFTLGRVTLSMSLYISMFVLNRCTLTWWSYICQ